MKKTLLLILIALLVALSIYIVLNGFQIGNIEVLSYNNIVQRNNELDDRIKEASKLVETNYRSAISDVQTAFKNEKDEKQEYENEAIVETEDGTHLASQIPEYQIEKIWVNLGTYATTEGVILQMDVKTAQSGMENRYDLDFTVNGSYIAITDFISDIENDSEILLKVDDFRITEDTSETDLVATFTCRNMKLKTLGASTNSQTSQPEQNENSENNNSTTTNTTNTTNSTNNTNTTNSTNSTNTTNNSTNNTTTNNTSNSTNTTENNNSEGNTAQ